MNDVPESKAYLIALAVALIALAQILVPHFWQDFEVDTQAVTLIGIAAVAVILPHVKSIEIGIVKAQLAETKKELEETKKKAEETAHVVDGMLDMLENTFESLFPAVNFAEGMTHVVRDADTTDNGLAALITKLREQYGLSRPADSVPGGAASEIQHLRARIGDLKAELPS